MDTVLRAPRPRLNPGDALGIAEALFGVAAASARDLGSERDLTVLLLDES